MLVAIAGDGDTEAVTDHIDNEGFRANVGIVLTDAAGRVFLARRAAGKGWQFPQGGIRRGETAEQAMYRELHEEIGLGAPQVEVLGVTRRWLPQALRGRAKVRLPALRGKVKDRPGRGATLARTSPGRLRLTAEARSCG